MGISVGIVGLPNVGKSTLFNALLKKQAALAANYPFATIEPNVGIVDVPDPRLDTLTALVKEESQAKFPHKEIPEKVVPATIKFNDIAGLVEGAHKGEGLGNQFLGHIREVDAIVHVVRAFEDENVIRSGSTEPESDIAIINTELILADYQSMEKRVEKAQLDLKRNRTKENTSKLSFYEKIVNILDEGSLIFSKEFTEVEKEMLKELNLLTSKPVIYVFNVSEEAITKGNTDSLSTYSNTLSGNFDKIILSAKIEADLCVLNSGEREEYMSELGINVTGLDKVIKHSYDLLNLQTYFTAGPKEVRAWTIEKGTKAPQAAGKIHTDFERGFISAEVISYSDYESAKTWKGAKEKGTARTEGKNYVMQDGDIVEFRFSV